MIRAPRRLSEQEIEALLALDVPARLATIDAEGFPHVTPLWFVCGTRRIDAKYGSARSAARTRDRVVIRLRPDRLIAVGSV